MKIVQALTHSGPGGGQEVVYTLVKTLKAIHPEVESTVVLPSNGIYFDRFKSLGVEVVEFPNDRISPAHLFGSKLFFNKLGADVIHSHGKGAGIYARLYSHSDLKTRRIHSYHGFHLPAGSMRRRLYLATESFLVNGTERIISVSQSESEDIVRQFPIAKRKLTVIENCVDVDAVIERSNKPIDPPLKQFIERHRTSFILTMIGRDDPVKNYPLALKMADLLLEKGRPAAFVFIGIDRSNADIRTLAEKYPDLVYSAGIVDNAAAVIRASSALFITSKKEGAPLVVLEAFALGKPVIGTNVPGLRDLVNHTGNGLLCRENPEELSGAIERLMDDKALYTCLESGARTKGTSMDCKAWAERYYTIYREVLD